VLRPNDTAALTRTIGGTAQTLATAPVAVEPGAWHTLSLTVEGRRLTGTVGGVTLTASDSYLYGGPAGLVTTWTTASFDSVLITD
jgi:hypothetical protein